MEDLLSTLIDRGLGFNPVAEQIMDKKIAKADNPDFFKTVYTNSLTPYGGKEKEKPNINDFLRTAKTVDDYNDISDAIKRLIVDLNMKATK